MALAASQGAGCLQASPCLLHSCIGKDWYLHSKKVFLSFVQLLDNSIVMKEPQPQHRADRQFNA
jgi:hypothetical protein